MSEFAKRVESAFKSRSVRTVEVPEWGLTLHIAPVTILQLQKINGESDIFRRCARILQVRAKNEQGLPLFDEQDYEMLCSHGIGEYGPDVVVRVAAEVMNDLPHAEDVAKN